MESLDHNPISSINNATHYRNPVPTVDIIIELWDRPESPIILIERLNSPFGWAIPGGFVDYGETIEQAAQREAMEETQLEIDLIQQFHVYSDPTGIHDSIPLALCF
jgi:8-oxo-dGTP diphosphatase